MTSRIDRLNTGRRFLVAASFLLTVCLVLGYLLKAEFLSTGGMIDTIITSVPPVDFELESVSGVPVRLSSVVDRSRVVVVSFWATWCGPCLLELRDLASEYREMKAAGLEVLAINVGESSETVLAFQGKEGFPFPLLLDRHGELARRYRIRAFPTTVLIQGGLVRRVYVGSDAYLTDELNRALGVGR